MTSEYPLRPLAGDADSRTAFAEDLVAMLKRLDQMRSHVAVTYRCPKRCLLAQILLVPKNGLLVHRPRYKMSPKLNADSSTAAGRAKYTEDGDRRWREASYFLVDAANLTLDCDHLHSAVVEVDQVEADAAARRREVTVGS